MFSRRLLLSVAGLLSLSAPFVLVTSARAQDERHGRKYKAPPETSHLEVLVVKDANGKVLENAAVIFHPTKDGDDEGNLEVKSGTDGKAFIDVIPTGSDVTIQVISNGYSTYAGTIKLTQPSHALTVRMKKPSDQVSAYAEPGRNGAKTVGVQEPIHAVAPPPQPKPLSSSQPVIKLPTLPSKAKDSTVPSGKAAKPSATPVKPADPSTPTSSAPSN